MHVYFEDMFQTINLLKTKLKIEPKLERAR